MKKLTMAVIVAAFAVSASPVLAADYSEPVDTYHHCPLLWPLHLVGKLLHHGG